MFRLLQNELPADESLHSILYILFSYIKANLRGTSNPQKRVFFRLASVKTLRSKVLAH